MFEPRSEIVIEVDLVLSKERPLRFFGAVLSEVEFEVGGGDDESRIGRVGSYFLRI